MSLEPWQTALIALAVVFVGLFVIIQLARLYAKRIYHKWLHTPVATPLDVDSFVNSSVNPPKYLKIAVLQRLSVGDRKATNEVIELSSYDSTHLPGLQITQRAQPRPGSNKTFETKCSPIKISSDLPAPLVIGTIRMGFGHHRIAYATCSWAIHADKDHAALSSTTAKTPAARTTYFHDLLNIDSPEADLIHSTDAFYSKMSRITSNLGGPFEKLWGKATLSGDADALRISGLTAIHLRPLFKDLPKDTPILATHCYVALAAVAAGMTNVINLVIDNHPQWFVVVPGCLNLVQGPVNYQSFLRMGVSPENLQLAGHWIPRDVCVSIPEDCAKRIARAKVGFADPVADHTGRGSPSTSTKSEAPKPRRFLIPVGGAGAQRNFIVQLLRALAPYVHSGSVQLFLNAGDHKHMHQAFEDTLFELGFRIDESYLVVRTLDGVRDFQKKLLEGQEPPSPITLFAFNEYFPAVATTDLISRVTDVLACKPSELAFYPVPKLMIRRVGDHEQYSALRAAELGDGTLEAREIDDAMTFVKCVINRPELLVSMNECIMKNATAGIYDGCKNAVKLVLQRAETQRREGHLV